MHLAITSPVGAVQPLVPCRSRERERDALAFLSHARTAQKKLRLPEWYVLAWMMERALNAVVRDVKTIYIGGHMPPSFRYLPPN